MLESEPKTFDSYLSNTLYTIYFDDKTLTFRAFFHQVTWWELSLWDESQNNYAERMKLDKSVYHMTLFI